MPHHHYSHASKWYRRVWLSSTRRGHISNPEATSKTHPRHDGTRRDFHEKGWKQIRSTRSNHHVVCNCDQHFNIQNPASAFQLYNLKSLNIWPIFCRFPPFPPLLKWEVRWWFYLRHMESWNFGPIDVLTPKMSHAYRFYLPLGGTNRILPGRWRRRGWQRRVGVSWSIFHLLWLVRLQW